MLRLYTLFHCNLAFSSIPKEHFPVVVKRCYEPLLALAEKGFPVAIEMTAWTLKEVNAIDPMFLERLRSLWDEGKCEFIGSGFSQAIFPLIPVDVNRWNLEIGNKYYQDLLGRRPSGALGGGRWEGQHTHQHRMPQGLRQPEGPHKAGRARTRDNRGLQGGALRPLGQRLQDKHDRREVRLLPEQARLGKDRG